MLALDGERAFKITFKGDSAGFPTEAISGKDGVGCSNVEKLAAFCLNDAWPDILSSVSLTPMLENFVALLSSLD